MPEQGAASPNTKQCWMIIAQIRTGHQLFSHSSAKLQPAADLIYFESWLSEKAVTPWGQESKGAVCPKPALLCAGTLWRPDWTAPQAQPDLAAGPAWSRRLGQIISQGPFQTELSCESQLSPPLTHTRRNWFESPQLSHLAFPFLRYFFSQTSYPTLKETEIEALGVFLNTLRQQLNSSLPIPSSSTIWHYFSKSFLLISIMNHKLNKKMTDVDATSLTTDTVTLPDIAQQS